MAIASSAATAVSLIAEPSIHSDDDAAAHAAVVALLVVAELDFHHISS